MPTKNMPPTPEHEPFESFAQKIEMLRLSQAEKRARELRELNERIVAEGGLPLTELPPEEPVDARLVAPPLRPIPPTERKVSPRIGKDAAAGRDDAPELVPDPNNPGQWIMKDFLPKD